jgi:hypothetical protein
MQFVNTVTSTTIRRKFSANGKKSIRLAVMALGNSLATIEFETDDFPRRDRGC